MGDVVEYVEIEEVLNKILGDHIGFETMVKNLMESGSLFSFGEWMKMLGEVLLEQLHSQGKTIGQLLLLIISAAVLATLANAFRNRQISDMGFYMIYLLVFLIMMRSFGNCYALAEEVIANLIDFMKVLMPAYLMAVAVSAYRTSATLYYEGFLLLVFYLQKLVQLVLLPAIRCYVLLSMLGHLGKEEFFARGREGLKKLILLLMKAMVGVTAGLQIIQGMISPAIDEWKQVALGKSISSLGNLGNMMGNLTDVVLGSGVLLKNGIGAAAAVILIGICMVPAVQAGCYVLVYQVLAVISDAISDKRFADAIARMGEGIALLVKLLFTVCAIFLLTIAVVCITTGGIR